MFVCFFIQIVSQNKKNSKRKKKTRRRKKIKERKRKSALGGKNSVTPGP